MWGRSGTGASAMSIIPLHLQRRFEQRWAARFGSLVIPAVPMPSRHGRLSYPIGPAETQRRDRRWRGRTGAVVFGEQGMKEPPTEAAYSVKAAKTNAAINVATPIAIRTRKNMIIPSDVG